MTHSYWVSGTLLKALCGLAPVTILSNLGCRSSYYLHLTDKGAEWSLGSLRNVHIATEQIVEAGFELRSVCW